MRTLVIEDDPSVSRSIQLTLASQGHSCVIADTGTAGIDQARKHRHDIVLLDLSLPDMSGHAVLQQFRALRIRTPVLILSGSDDLRDKINGLGVGADDYVTKPFDKDELLARIKAILRRATGRTPPPKAANLDSTLLAKRGQAAAWSFADSYAPPVPNTGQSSGNRSELGGRPEPGTRSYALTSRPTSAAGSGPADHALALGPAKIIVLGNGKGGTGKSTVAMHLIVALLTSGQKVASFDCDCPQGTLTRYIENRRRFTAGKDTSLPMPTHEALNANAHLDGRAGHALVMQSRRNDYVVIDTPGHDTPLSRWAHGYADILVTPINDSFIDLDVLAEISDEPCQVVRPSHYSELVHEARRGKSAERHDIDWIVLRNRLANLDAQNRRRMAGILTQLCKSLGFREGPGLRERVIYRELFLSGLTLLDLPRDDLRLRFAMSHVAARQELRHLLEAVAPLSGAVKVGHPKMPKNDIEVEAVATQIDQPASSGA